MSLAPPFEIRAHDPADDASLLEIYRHAIHGSAAPYYSLEQRLAWAPASLDAEAWSRRMALLRPRVVWAAGRPVAYADLQPDGYIDHFFVHPDAGGRGVGRLLLDALVREARALGLTCLEADVSLAAEGFFAKQGFVLVARARNPIRGVEVPNARMRLALEAAPRPHRLP